MKNTRTFLVACSKLKSALIQGIIGLEKNVYYGIEDELLNLRELAISGYLR